MRSTAHSARALLRILDYLIVLRPTLLLPVWTLVLLGHYQGARRVGTDLFHLSILSQASIEILLYPGLRLWGVICLYSMLMGAVYVVNQIADRETDEVNDKLYLVAQGYVNIRALKIEAVSLFIASGVWAAAWYQDNPACLLLIFLSMLLGVIYSVRPCRLKGRPFLDLLANAIGYGGVAYLIGWATVGPIDAGVLWQTLPYMLCVGAAFVNTTLPDLKGDSAVGDRTTGVSLGVHRSCQLSLALLVGAIASAGLLRNLIVLIVGLICLPFFVYINFDRRKSVIIWATRVGILGLTILACIVVPCYFILFICTLLFVRWYYAARFSIKYP